MFENRGSRKIFGPKRDGVTGSAENYITRTLMICTPHPTFSGDQIQKKEMGGTCSTYGGEERCIQGFVGENCGRNHLVDTGVDGRIILRWILRKWDVGIWTGSIWFRRGTGGGHL